MNNILKNFNSQWFTNILHDIFYEIYKYAICKINNMRTNEKKNIHRFPCISQHTQSSMVKHFVITTQLTLIII